MPDQIIKIVFAVMTVIMFIATIGEENNEHRKTYASMFVFGAAATACMMTLGGR